jgi:beta-glucosidase-like glycosyl hydrolase
VLLKNDGILPLTPGAHKRVAVIGPNAAVARLAVTAASRARRSRCWMA